MRPNPVPFGDMFSAQRFVAIAFSCIFLKNSSLDMSYPLFVDYFHVFRRCDFLQFENNDGSKRMYRKNGFLPQFQWSVVLP